MYDPNRYSNAKLRQTLSVASSDNISNAAQLTSNPRPLPHLQVAPPTPLAYPALAPSNLGTFSRPLSMAEQMEQTVKQMNPNPNPNPNQNPNPNPNPNQMVSVPLTRMDCTWAQNADPQLLEHRWVAKNRPLPGQSAAPQGQPGEPIYVNLATNGAKSGSFADFNQSMYEQPYDRMENMTSNGFFTNAYTGETYETFLLEPPGPTTDKYRIDPDSLKHTNPKLIYLNGGIDPNAMPISKQETELELPGPDGGPNVWGDQLYQDAIRLRIRQMVGAQIFNNRNGDTPVEREFARERPAGYVGYQPVYRATPYLPPRNELDLKGWVGPAAAQVAPVDDPLGQLGLVTTHRIDNGPGYTGNMVSDIGTMSGPEHMNPSLQVRGQRETDWQGNPVLDYGNYVVIDPTVKETLKSLEEQTKPITGFDYQASTSGYVVIDPTVRATLKTLQEQTLQPVAIQSQAPDATGLVVLDPTVRQTLKQFTELAQPLVQIQTNLPESGYVILDPTVRETLKQLEELSRPLVAIQPDLPSQGYVVLDPTVRETLKHAHELSHSLASLQIQAADSGYVPVTTVRETLKRLTELSSTNQTLQVSMPDAGYVLLDPTLRETLKTLQEQARPDGPVQISAPDSSYVILDPTVRQTLKRESEQNVAQMHLQYNGPEALVAPQFTTPRDTLKTLQEQARPLAGFQSDIPSSSYVILDPSVKDTLKILLETPSQFPGLVDSQAPDTRTMPAPSDKDTRRQYYSDQTYQAGFDHLAGTDNTGPRGPDPLQVSWQPFRGTQDTYRVALSRVVEQSGGTGTVPEAAPTTRDPRRELLPVEGAADFTQSNGFQAFTDRMLFDFDHVSRKVDALVPAFTVC